MRFRIFISSVQSEFAEARHAVKDFLLGDPLLREFVENVFLFEDEPAAAAGPEAVYLDQIGKTDIYIGIFGTQYGYTVADGELSPTEKEYNAAEKRGLPLWVYFYDQSPEVDPRMAKLKRRVDEAHKRRRVGSIAELTKQVYATFIQYLRDRKLLTQEPFDAAYVEDATLDDIDVSRVQWFFRKAVEERGFPQVVGSSAERILKHILVMRESDGKLTRAALMLFGKRPKRFCTSGIIKCICCAGTEYRRPFVMQVYEGDLFDQIDQAEIFVLSHVNRIVGTREADDASAPITYDIPKRAIREAIVNAVAHRDYFSNGSVEVRVFSDRVEVLNPGELPPGKDLAWLMGEHVSIPANPLIAEAFYQTHYIDRAGSGIDDMSEACRTAGVPLPTIRVEYQSFVTTIRRLVHGVSAKKNPMQNTKKKPADDESSTNYEALLRSTLPKCTDKKIRTSASIVAFLRKNPFAKYVDITAALRISFWTVKDHIALLKKFGVLVRIGGDNGGHWEIVIPNS